MKTFGLLLAIVGLSNTCFAQKPTIKWGEELKMTRGSTDLEVIMVDPSGAYLQEGHQALGTYFVVGATTRSSASLVKVDKNLTEVYRNDFNKELKGKEFVQFLPLGDQLFLIASDYSKRDRTLGLFGATVNKANGELTGDFRELAVFQKEEKKDDINYQFTYNSDTTKIILVSSIAGKEKNEYKVQEFNSNLKSGGSPITLVNEFEAKKYQLQDLLYLSNRKIVLVGRVMEYAEGKKKKEKFLEFSNYNIRIYDEKGAQQSEINTTVNGKWLNSTKVMQEKNNDLILTGFYSNAKKAKTIDGLLVQRIDVNSGKVISTNEKQIDLSMVSDDKDKSDDDLSKEEKRARDEAKKKDDDESFSKYMVFRNIFYTEDNGLIILAEKYHTYRTEHTSTTTGNPNTAFGMNNSGRTTYRYHYDCGDLLVCKINNKGDIGWMKVVPKNQRESLSFQGPSSNTMSFGFSYVDFFTKGNYPFYSSFSAMQKGNNIFLFFNDKAVNGGVTEAGQKAKPIYVFGQSTCFWMNLDVTSGKMTRKVFFVNSDIPTAMPRLGVMINDEMYMVGKEDRTFGKTKIAIGKVTIK